MDNVTHSLTGLALARAGLNRYSPHALALLLVSANLPDSDIIAGFKGPLTYLEWHRGYTHSIVALPVMSAISVLIVAALFQTRLPWGKAWLLCCIGLASHLLLDWTNGYGIRLMLPFSSRWFHLDCTALYDGWIMAVLLFAAIWPVFSRMVSREIGSRERAGRLIPVCALLFFAFFDAARLVLHARAISQLQARLFDNMPPIQTAAMPQAFNPFAWTGIVETERTFQRLPVNTLGEIDPVSAQIFFKPPRDPAIDAAKTTKVFRYGEYFVRFPVWSESRVSLDRGVGVRVELADLRFGGPQSGSFHCIALEDAGFRVLRDWFTFGSGTDLGWGKDVPPTTDQQ